MNILAHRGFWNTDIVPNSTKAFEHAFNNGFGIETDVRDFQGEPVISHDPPISSENLLSFKDFLKLHQRIDPSLTLAINIKADGLAESISNSLSKYSPARYFVFDGSVPDSLKYLAQDIPCYTRQSEYEQSPSFYKESAGVWMDAFKSDWYCLKDIEKHLEARKDVCIVSPELHKRDYTEAWKVLKKVKHSTSSTSLCTDFPDKARSFFCE